MSFRTDDPSSLPIGPHPIVNPHHRTHVLLPVAAGGFGAALSVIVLLFLCRRLPRRRTAPLDSKPPHRLPYALLRRATASFAAHNLLGRGGFGPVYKGVAVHPFLDGDIAVKVMDAGSLQGEREFQNELLFAQRLNQSAANVAPAIGFSSSQRRRRRRLCLVYDLMRNGNLQDALLRRKCAELMEWRNRFSIAVDIAKGIEHLHHSFDPPIIHGDIKPSNILLDHNFAAKIGDFGLARLKSEEVAVAVDVDVTAAVEMTGVGLEGAKKVEGAVEDSGSVAEEAESVITVVEEFNYGVTPSPEPDILGKVEAAVSLEAVERAGASSPEMIEVVVEDLASSPSTVVSEGTFDKGSVDSGGNRSCRENKSVVSRRQDNMNGDSGDRQVKDYVMDWIGTEVRKERPKSSWIATSSDSAGAVTIRQPEQKRFDWWKKNGRRLEWWATLDDEKNVKKENRRPREWWKEEFCEELARKKKKKKKLQHEMGVSNECNEDSCWPKDEELYAGRRRKKSRRNSKSSVDLWLDGAKHCSYDSVSGEIPKSGGISSTPSMRGTVCYIAPEYGGGGGGYVSEKCDVYSFGVLLLVLVAGRRPLQVTGSPMSEFQRANLISWARHLARSGKLHELVDQCIISLNQEQALLCIIVALLCLQKQPARRPSMKEVVGMLCGELGRPQLPVEFSPSPPSRVSFKSRKKRFS